MAKRKQRKPLTLIQAVTHIPLRESNAVKLDVLNAVANTLGAEGLERLFPMGDSIFCPSRQNTKSGSRG